MDPRLRKYLHQIGQWASLWGIFLFNNWHGRTQPTVDGASGVHQSTKGKWAKSWRASQEVMFLLHSCLSPALTSLTDPLLSGCVSWINPFLPELFFVMVFITALENEQRQLMVLLLKEEQWDSVREETNLIGPSPPGIHLLMAGLCACWLPGDRTHIKVSGGASRFLPTSEEHNHLLCHFCTCGQGSLVRSICRVSHSVRPPKKHHLLALWKLTSTDKVCCSVPDWFIYVLQPKYVASSVVVSSHLVVVNNQEQWQEFMLFVCVWRECSRPPSPIINEVS